MAPSKLASLQRIFPGRNQVAALVLASSLLGCATQAQTGQLLSAAGTAAVIAGAVMASDSCYEYERGYDARGQPCGGGGMSGSEKAGLALAVAGLATTAVGNALQEDAARLDARRSSRPAPTHTPTTLPPPGYTPSGGINLFGAPTVVLTTSCTCPLPAAAPESAGSAEGTSSATPEATAEGAAASEASGDEQAQTSPAAPACPCAGSPAATPGAPATSEGEPEAAPAVEAAPPAHAPAQ